MLTLTPEAIQRSLSDSRIPPYLHGGLVRWLVEGVTPGSFLKAVISNDLREAVITADAVAITHLPTIVRWLIDNAPRQSHGMYDALISWPSLVELRQRRERREIAVAAT